MGGLISNAAGALCKGAGLWRRCSAGQPGMWWGNAGRGKHGQWQISQAEQVACSCGWHSADASVVARSAAVL